MHCYYLLRIQTFAVSVNQCWKAGYFSRLQKNCQDDAYYNIEPFSVETSIMHCYTSSVMFQCFTHNIRNTLAFALYKSVEMTTFFIANPYGDYIVPGISTWFAHRCEFSLSFWMHAISHGACFYNLNTVRPSLLLPQPEVLLFRKRTCVTPLHLVFLKRRIPCQEIIY